MINLNKVSEEEAKQMCQMLNYMANESVCPCYVSASVSTVKTEIDGEVCVGYIIQLAQDKKRRSSKGIPQCDLVITEAAGLTLTEAMENISGMLSFLK